MTITPPIHRFRESPVWRAQLVELNAQPYFKEALLALERGLGMPFSEPPPVAGLHPDQATARHFHYMRGINDAVKYLREVMTYENGASPMEAENNEEEYAHAIPKEFRKI